MELQQRILISGPIENVNLRPPPLFARPEATPTVPVIRQIVGHQERYDALSNGHSPLEITAQGRSYPQLSPYEQSTSISQQATFDHRTGYTSTLGSPTSAQFVGYHRQELDSQSDHSRRATHVRSNDQMLLPLRGFEEHPTKPLPQAPFSHYSPPSQGRVVEIPSKTSPTPSDGSWTLSSAPASPNFKDQSTKSAKSEKSHFSSVGKLFGKKSRSASIDMAKSDTPHNRNAQASAVPRHLMTNSHPEQVHDSAPSRKASAPLPSTPASSYNGSRFSSMSASTMTTQSSYEAPETPDFNPWGRSFPSSIYPFEFAQSRDMCLCINAYPRAEMLTPKSTTGTYFRSLDSSICSVC